MNPYSPEDSRYDLWPLYDVTPSSRPRRYEEYKRAQFGRGRVFDELAHLKWCRETLAFWKKRDPSSNTVRLARDAFYDRLGDLREMHGPVLPDVTTQAFRRAA